MITITVHFDYFDHDGSVPTRPYVAYPLNIANSHKNIFN